MPQEASEISAEEIVRFWEEIGPKNWYAVEPELDATITRRFGATWERAAAGAFRDWLGTPRGALAYLILTDQFPRNMFRGDARAFATDAMARDAAMAALHRGHDLQLPEPIRQFFYLPFMHAESTFDQDRCVCLMLTRMPESGASNLHHARAHRAVIRQFGRFPYRNVALGRKSTPQEEAFLEAGGYAAAVAELA